MSLLIFYMRERQEDLVMIMACYASSGIDEGKASTTVQIHNLGDPSGRYPLSPGP